MISLPWVSCWFIRVVVGDGNLEGWGLWVYFLTPVFGGVGVGKRVHWQSPVYHKEEMFGKEIAEFNVSDPKQGQEFSATYHKERHLKIATSHLVQQHLASCFRFVGVDPTRPSGDRRFLSHCNYPLILPNEKLGAWHGVLNIHVIPPVLPIQVYQFISQFSSSLQKTSALSAFISELWLEVVKQIERPKKGASGKSTLRMSRCKQES